jgi:hypothetical protein
MVIFHEDRSWEPPPGIIIIIYLFIYSSLFSLCNRLGYERQTPHLF